VRKLFASSDSNELSTLLLSDVLLRALFGGWLHGVISFIILGQCTTFIARRNFAIILSKLVIELSFFLISRTGEVDSDLFAKVFSDFLKG
jgi:hypothetical protein